MPTKDITNARDKFIAEKHDQGFEPADIPFLLKRHGFREVSRARIYQVLEKTGRHTRRKK